jgi:DNA (cytosine-5)-methyltransferase 1
MSSFAGGGMARLGLGKRWKCLLANELCQKKADAYRINHNPNGELIVDDVANLILDRVPDQATLSWASFPCQDLSLAGNGKGLKGNRSGTFWPFWNLMGDLSDAGRPVPIIVLENVVGALTSNKGTDFRAIVDALILKGYVFGLWSLMLFIFCLSLARGFLSWQ